VTRHITLDRDNDRLIFLSGAPDRGYWEGLWHTQLTRNAISRGDQFVVDETRRVLPVGARILDAGCGIGATVYGLDVAGFDAYGIDNAEDTIRTIQSYFPVLKVSVADVRSLPFKDNDLDGVWSLGVIEHFFDGYEILISEAHRVLRPGGFLFLTVPTISPLKALRIQLGRYPNYSPRDRENFFQFAFRRNHVATSIVSHGFILQQSFGRSGSFGLTEDLGSFSHFMLPSPSNQAFWARAWWRIADKFLTPFSYHVRYYLFQKI